VANGESARRSSAAEPDAANVCARARREPAAPINPFVIGETYGEPSLDSFTRSEHRGCGGSASSRTGSR
jgi:hypothetical protein